MAQTKKPKKDRRLWTTLSNLVDWQREHSGQTESRCLEAMRHCLPKGLTLPWEKDDTALWAGEQLVKHSTKHGWRLLGTNADALPTDRPTLVFFDDCGTVKGRVCGHVAIFKPTTNHLVGNTTYNGSQWWMDRVFAVFEPIPEDT